MITAQVPKRFLHCRFENYHPDPDFVEQEKIRKLLQIVIQRINNYTSSSSIKKFFIRQKSDIRALYLDGGFGVGKTHLLAAAYHSFTSTKLFFSFSDLMHHMSYYGIESFFNQIAGTHLICIDEFELDDPANTMKAGHFIREAVARDMFIISSSNTIPENLGQGRFNYKNFENEIGELSRVFKTYTISGKDYRSKETIENYSDIRYTNHFDDSFLSFNVLHQKLANMPMLEIENMVQKNPLWKISHIQTILHQDQALRFVHFIDKVYDNFSQIQLHSFLNSTRLFHEDYIKGSYSKKYYRCLSRLHELTHENSNVLSGIKK